LVPLSMLIDYLGWLLFMYCKNSGSVIYNSSYITLLCDCVS
jgi:hypothetical protein